MLIIIHNLPDTPAYTVAHNALNELEGVETKKVIPPYMRDFWDTEEAEEVIIGMLSDALGAAGLRIEAIEVTLVSERESRRLKIQAGAVWRREWYAHRKPEN